MNPFSVLFFLANAAALLTLPRRWAPVPLLIGTCYITVAQGITIGSFTIRIFQMLLAVGLIRLFVRREPPAGLGNSVDRLMFVLLAWMMGASIFHEWAPGSGPGFVGGIVFNVGLVYLLIRSFCRDLSEIQGVIKAIAILMVPIALEMSMEKLTGRNAFAVFGGVDAAVAIRNGHYRAQGPFRHSILAGAVGAACAPLMAVIWQENRRFALLGVAACLAMVVTSTSSTPLMSVVFGLIAIALWPYRRSMRNIRAAVLVVYLLLYLVMTRPPYYLIASIDLSGGSTGWHRARLIQMTIEHFGEWWRVGTDHTRHWMPTGVTWSENHTDITSYYIQFAVWGGAPALFLVLAILWRSFCYIGELIRTNLAPESLQFPIWCVGAAMFSQAATAVSVSYFDQSQLFFWMNIALISSLRSALVTAGASDPASDAPPTYALDAEPSESIPGPVAFGR